MNYKKNFNDRVNKYIYSINKYPNVMHDEFKTAINELNLKINEKLVNLFAGGNNLKSYIPDNLNISYKEYETNIDFCNLCNIKHFNINNIPENTGDIDKIIILSTLHHLDDKEREKLYKECYRILKNNGTLIIGDVLKNSKQDKWLNLFVNMYNSKGHEGKFFDENDINLLEKTGYSVKMKINKYLWKFKNKNEMEDFISNLFYLDLFKSKNLSNFINEYLDVVEENQGIYIKWELLYFVCIKKSIP